MDGTYLVGREKVREYARAVQDYHPAHWDVAAAAELGYSELVAPLTFTSAPGMSCNRRMFESVVVGYDTYLQTEEVFEQHRPIVAGDELHVDVERTITRRPPPDRARIIGNHRLPDPMTMDARSSSVGTPDSRRMRPTSCRAAQVRRECAVVLAQAAQVDNPETPAARAAAAKFSAPVVSRCSKPLASPIEWTRKYAMSMSSSAVASEAGLRTSPATTCVWRPTRDERFAGWRARQRTS